MSFEGNGSASFGERHLLGIKEAGKYKAEVSMYNFAPYQLNPGGERTCVVAITMEKVSTRTLGLSDPYLDKFRDENVTVKVRPADSLMPSTYTADLVLNLNSTSDLSVKIGTATIVDAGSKDERRRNLPLQMDDDSHYWLKDSGYGWWPAGN